MSNFIFMLGASILCYASSNKIPTDALGISCVVAALVDVWAWFFWRK
jgi:hypothetical protein